MKILFICGSLQPGEDGVGDYTRKIAGEMIRRGQDINIISLYDKNCGEVKQYFQYDEKTQIPVLRIPIRLKYVNRYLLVKEFIHLNKPDWLSLQFVPYSFHPKGLPLGLIKKLNGIGKGNKWHIMLHELYVEPSDFKSWVLSKAQSIIIYSLVNVLKPILINTHLPVYRDRLLKLGIIANPLPIFSNITNVKSLIDKEENLFTIAFFSQFKVRDSVIFFLKEISKEVLREGLELKILLIGGNSNAMIELRDALESIEDFKQNISYTGKLNESDLSKTIQKCDLGMSPVPRHLIGKSGSIAAFLVNGVPVAAPYVKPGFLDTDIGFFSKRLQSAIITNPAFGHFQKAAKVALTISEQVRVSEVSKIFISQLQKASLGSQNKKWQSPDVL